MALNPIRILRYATEPSVLMVLVWVVLWTAFALGPLEYYRQPSLQTWLIAWGGVSLFCAGSLAAKWLPYRQGGRLSRIEAFDIDRVIVLFAWIGIGGIVLMAVDKLLLSGLDYAQGLAAVRYQRAAEVAAGVELRRTPLLFIGYLTFSLSYVSIGLFFMEAERVSRKAAWWAQLSVVSPVGYALVYGGRAPILILCLLVIGAGMVRTINKRPFLPRNYSIGWKFLVLCLGFLAYLNYTWEDRREYSKIADYREFLAVADQSWALTPKPWVHDAVKGDEIPSDTAMNSMSIALYVTHGVVSLDKIREHWLDLGAYMGQFQIGVLHGFIRVFLPEMNYAQMMVSDLSNADIYGWFVTAWGAWYLDFGLPASAVCIFLWGLLCGIWHCSVRESASPFSGLLLSFGYCSILVSPINAPLGMANSALVLAAYIATAVFFRARIRGCGVAKLAQEPRQVEIKGIE